MSDRTVYSGLIYKAMKVPVAWIGTLLSCPGFTAEIAKTAENSIGL